jgi:hypothetical protein
MTTAVHIAVEMRHFRVAILQADIDDLRRRLVATCWREKETVA